MNPKKNVMGNLLETSNPEVLEKIITELSADYGVKLPIAGALAIGCKNMAELEERIKKWHEGEFDDLPEVVEFNALVDE